MATNVPFDWRRYDRQLFLAVAILFPLIVVIGFGRTYYFKALVGTPSLSSMLVHVHGLIMTAWVVFFIAQVWLIRTKNTKLHMKMGMLGIGLAVLLIVVGFFTAAGAAKNGSPSAPPDFPPLGFFVVPIGDLVMFAALFGAAIYYRLNSANHKRLMLLTVINFIPPAVARIPLAFGSTAGPGIIVGVPVGLTVAVLIYDSVRNRKLNRVFLIGSIALIASYPLRIWLSGNDMWMSFAAWVTTWAA